MDKVYISFKKNSQVTDRKVTVGDVASVWCADPKLLSVVKSLIILKIPETNKYREVVSALKVISIIGDNVKNADINNLGETEFIVSYQEKSEDSKIFEIIKVFIITVIMFCGGAFAIMAYGNDVDVNGIFETINEWMEGPNKGALILQIAYSVGLTLGIIVFYNHFSKKKQYKDPTPIEIQMRLYEDDISTAVISNSEREEQTDDVG